MRRPVRSAVAAAIAVVSVAAAPLTSSGSWEPTPGGWVSGPVDYVGTIPFEAGTGSDAVLHGDLLTVTTWRSFSIYDVSDALAPVRLSTTHLAGALINEQPQTNGEILLISRDAQYLPRTGPPADPLTGAVLEIYDVTDPSRPVLVATWQNERTGFLGANTRRDHIWSCVHGCRYAYSAGGTILDLADPSDPMPIGDWSVNAPFEAMHHIDEVAPGIVLTGSDPMHLLDARDHPEDPDLLATVQPHITEPSLVSDPVTVPNPVANPTSLPARLAWPDALHGRVAMVTMETPFTGPCTDDSGDLQTFLTPGWRDTSTFEPADRYQLTTNGTYTDGAPAYNAFGCSAYGLDVHPGFSQRGGSVGVSFFEHGVRILDIDGHGKITESGGYLPLAGNSTAVVWVTDEILYVVDAHRGIDLLRVRPAGR